MWTRRTFHECAYELREISGSFRAAYVNKFGVPESRRSQILQGTSERGVEVLRILALSIRSEQDFHLTPNVNETVGAINSNVASGQVPSLFKDYRPPYYGTPGFDPLHLREALNKIAHANPMQASFFASESVHDLLLSGTRSGRAWVAIISLIDLCAVIESMPDQNVARA